MLVSNLLLKYAGQVSGSCVDGQVRLWTSYNNVGPSNEGLALYCRDGTWRGVCSYGTTCDNANVICKQLGYLGALS